MKKVIKSIAIFLVIMLAVTAIGCSKPAPADAPAAAPAEGADAGKTKDPIVLKLGHIQSEEDLWHIGAQRFSELVTEKTNGEIKIELYPNSTLGNDRDMAEGLQMGSLDFSLISGVLGNFEPSLQLLELPYLFRDAEHLRKVLYGPIGDELYDRLLKSSGIRGLAYWECGSRQLTTQKPINSVKDIKGLKIRVPEIPAMVDAWKAMGANPTPMAWGEVYSALSQGVVDAQENPYPFIYAGRIHEVTKYIAETNHKYEYIGLIMSEKTYQKLTPEQQKAIEEAAAEATEYENKLVNEQANEFLQKMVDAGIKVTHPNTEEFAKLARTTHAKYAEECGKDIYDQIINTK